MTYPGGGRWACCEFGLCALHLAEGDVDASVVRCEHAPAYVPNYGFQELAGIMEREAIVIGRRLLGFDA